MIFGLRMRGAIVVGVVAAGAATLVACSSILGFDSLTLDPNGAGSVDGGQDGGTDGEIATADGGADGADGCASADPTTSAQHCGRCGHDCGGGKCQKSKCQPLRLAEGLAVPEGLVVDETSVFVAENDANRIVRLDKIPHGECDQSPLPTACIFTEINAVVPTAMGIDETNVYWTSQRHSIRSCPRAGCGGQAPVVRASFGDPVFDHDTGDFLPLDLIVRDGQIFFPESYSGAVTSVAVDGGAVTTYLPGGSFSPVAIAVDDSNIFFTGDGNSGHAAEIVAVPRDASGTFRVVANAGARTWGIGLSPGGTLYWTVPGLTFDNDGKVQATPKTADGGAPLGGFAGAQADPRGLVVDAVNVYWISGGETDKATGKVLYCPQAGCPDEGPIVLAEQQRVPRHLTQDDAAIYWSNEGLAGGGSHDGQVWKIAKP